MIATERSIATMGLAYCIKKHCWSVQCPKTVVCWLPQVESGVALKLPLSP